MPGIAKEAPMQMTLTIVKPEGVRRALVGKVISRFEEKGLELRALTYVRASPEQIRENYQANADEPWFEEMVTYMTSGYIVPIAWQGPLAIDSARQVIGSKDPWESESGSLRGQYAADPLRTLVHGSRDPVEAIKEINLWFPSLLGFDEPEPKSVPALRVPGLVRYPVADLLTVKSYAPLRQR